MAIHVAKEYYTMCLRIIIDFGYLLATSEYEYSHESTIVPEGIDLKTSKKGLTCLVISLQLRTKGVNQNV